MRTGIACLLAMACLGARAAEIPVSEKNRLAALLPGVKTSAPVRFYGSDLYRYLDGGADAYLKRGMVAMVHQESKIRGAEATVDIYDMGDRAKAAGLFAAERSPESRGVAVGADGYISGEILNFVEGRYYVKLSVFAEGNSAEPLLRELAGAISAKIGGARKAKP